MDFKELLQFINLQDKRLIKSSDHNNDLEKRILARTVKLNEEAGELCNEVLGYNNDQRAEKLDNFNKDSLSDEFADVIITTLLIAKSMNVDIENALEKKIKKINNRYSE